MTHRPGRRFRSTHGYGPGLPGQQDAHGCRGADGLRFPGRAHSAVETAAWLKADDRAVGIFLNGLAALGLLVKGVDYFQNSKLASRFLVRGSNDYRGAILQHMGHTWERGWNDLKNTVLMGFPHGIEPESWVDTRPKRDEEGMRAFIWGMHALARDLAPQVAAKLDLKGCAPSPGLGGRPGHLRHHLCPDQPRN